MEQSPFFWGANGAQLTYGQAKKKREVADALAARNSTPQTFGAGLNRIGEALLAKSMGDQATAAEDAGAESRKAVIEALIGNPDPGMGDIYGALGNEWVANDPGSSAIVQALLGQELQQNDPLRQLQIEKLGLEVDGIRNPPEPGPEYDFVFGPNGELIRTDKTSGGVDALGNFAEPTVPEAPTVKTIFDPETGREQVVQWNPATSAWDPVGGVQAPKDPLVQVNTGEVPDAALNKALSGKEGESWASYKDAAAVSGSNAQDFEILGELMALAPQGPITGRLADTFKGFNSAGDAAKSIIRRIAPTLRAPGSGSTSDIEYQGMLDSLPSLINDPAANDMILSIMQAKAQLNMERGEIVTAYQNGDITVAEARSKMDELNRRSIMSPEMRRALLGVGDDGNVGEPPPNVGDEVDGYTYQGGDPSSPSSWKKVI